MWFPVDERADPANPGSDIDAPVTLGVFAQFGGGLLPLASCSHMIPVLEMVGADRKMNQSLKIPPVRTVESVPELLPQIVCLKESSRKKLAPPGFEELECGFWVLRSVSGFLGHMILLPASCSRWAKITTNGGRFQVLVT